MSNDSITLSMILLLFFMCVSLFTRPDDAVPVDDERIPGATAVGP